MSIQTRNTSKPKTQIESNPIKDAFEAERKRLIEHAKVLRAKREALRGVSGTQVEWRELTTQIADTQTRINGINDGLGIRNKTFPPLNKPGAAPAAAHVQKPAPRRFHKYKNPGVVGESNCVIDQQ